MALFSLDRNGTALPGMPVRSEGVTAAKLQRFESMHTAKVAIVKEHLNAPPGPGEVVFIWTTAQFNTMSMIMWLIEERGLADELLLSTYSISNICVSTFLKWMDSGQIGRVYMYISDYFTKLKSKRWDMLLSAKAARPGRLDIGIGFNHSKVTLLSVGPDRFVITGSGNFSENAINEQYTICNNAEIYEFFKQCLTEDRPLRLRKDRLAAAGRAEVGNRSNSILLRLEKNGPGRGTEESGQ